MYDVATPTLPHGRPTMIDAMVSGLTNMPNLNISFARPCVMSSHPVVFVIGWINAPTPNIPNSLATGLH